MADASGRPLISEKAHAECVRLLDLLTNKRVQESWSWVFMAPVSGIPGYHEVIKKPMDLGTVKKNLGSKPSRCRFKSHERFAKDVRLVFQNALVYNKEDEHVKGSVFDAAQHLLRVFENAYAKAKETVLKDEDDAADHNSSTNDEQDAAAATHASGEASDKSHHHHHSSSSHSHSHGHSSSEHESSSSKHKKDKSSKKEKKAKKSKKKSKDKDKDRERDRERSKDKDRERERERKGSVSDESHKKNHTTSGSSSSSHKTATSSSNHNHDRPASGSDTTPAAHIVHAGDGAKITSSVSSSKATSASATNAGGKMSEETMNACLGVLMKLIKYKEGNVSPAAPFLQPVDLMHFPDYKIKVPNRMHLYGVQKKLRSGGYATIDTFAYDVRLVFSNCLVYNSDVVLSKVIRSHAVTLIKLFEAQFAKIGGSWPGIPERWKCHQIIHEILANRTDGLETAQWFKYPIETYFDSADQVPYGYFKTIKHPMDLGTVSAKLHLGIYRHASELLHDLKLIFDNCIRYWSSDPHGATYCESAKKLIEVLKTQSSAVLGSQAVDKVASRDNSSKAASSSAEAHSSVLTVSKDRRGSSTSAPSGGASSGTLAEEERSRKRSSKHISSNFPQKEVCMEILRALRQHKMKGYHGIEILTAGPFLHAVDVTKYPDYLQVVNEPMDFAKIERKLKGDRYSDLNEFSADVHLIFSNCHKYNSDPIEGADIRAMASNLRDHFVDLYNEKFGDGEKPARSSTSAPALATLPSARLESSRSSSASAKAISPSTEKKTPLASPTKKPPVSASLSAPFAQDDGSKTASVTKTGSRQVESSATVPDMPSSSSLSVAKSSSSTANLTHQELEEYKKRKKERKEKKDKKDKKKKDKKEKKKKDKDRKDKKEKDKNSQSRTEGTAPVPSAHSTSSVKTQVPVSEGLSSKPTSVAPSSAAASAAPARVLHVPSKISPAESTPAASKSKAKKSKKSELSGWEASAERVLNRLVKIEQVAKLHFDQPLLEVFPHLEHEYKQFVHEPMDLRTLREKLHDHSVVSPVAFHRLGRLIFQNAIKFNHAPDPASIHVREMSEHLLWYFESLCLELKLTEASTAGSRLEDLRQERAELANNTPMEVKAKECQKLLRVLNSQKYDKNCWPFRKPVQVLFPTLPAEYFEIIQTPMDLATISEKLVAFEYKVHGEFIRDVRLTFENALRYNHADKDREGWNVYSAAVHMLAVVNDQWWDVTLEVLERVRRRELVRKERDRLGEKRKGEALTHDARKVLVLTNVRPSSVATGENASLKTKPSISTSDSLDPAVIAKASITIAPPSSRDDPESSTKLRLQITRPNIDRMNKSERKAEEKRRKRARREEEIAKSEKRRRTAVAATDDALREAELRSRRRIQKMEIAEAVKQREERERQQREDDAAKSLAVKMKFNASSWTGQLATSSQGFWLRKPTKLQVPAAFLPAIDSY